MNMERRLSNKELDRELSKVQFSSNIHQATWDKISNQVWFRQYARGSSVALKKITKKIKDGIKKNKYTTSDLSKPVSGFEKPSKIKKKKKTSKGEKKLKKETEKLQKKTKRTVKEPEKVIKQDKRKKRVVERAQTEKAPSGRAYSKTELREGKGSKRSREWRKRNGIDENDF